MPKQYSQLPLHTDNATLNKACIHACGDTGFQRCRNKREDDRVANHHQQDANKRDFRTVLHILVTRWHRLNNEDREDGAQRLAAHLVCRKHLHNAGVDIVADRILDQLAKPAHRDQVARHLVDRPPVEHPAAIQRPAIRPHPAQVRPPSQIHREQIQPPPICSPLVQRHVPVQPPAAVQQPRFRQIVIPAPPPTAIQRPSFIYGPIIPQATIAQQPSRASNDPIAVHHPAPIDLTNHAHSPAPPKRPRADQEAEGNGGVDTQTTIDEHEARVCDRSSQNDERGGNDKESGAGVATQPQRNDLQREVADHTAGIDEEDQDATGPANGNDHNEGEHQAENPVPDQVQVPVLNAQAPAGDPDHVDGVNDGGQLDHGGEQEPHGEINLAYGSVARALASAVGRRATKFSLRTLKFFFGLVQLYCFAIWALAMINTIITPEEPSWTSAMVMVKEL